MDYKLKSIEAYKRGNIERKGQRNGSEWILMEKRDFIFIEKSELKEWWGRNRFR